MLTLYYAPFSAALAPHIVLEEIGADYEARRVDFGAAEQRSAEYLVINPKGRVPALVTDRGTLTESPAVLAFLAQTYPAARLAPLGDPFAFARAQEFNAFLCATVHVAHAHGRRAERWTLDPAAQEALKAEVPRCMTEAFALIEDRLEGPWVLGEDYSICDPYLFTMARWLERDGVDTAALPRVLAHRGRIQERPAVQRIVALHSR